MMAETIAFVALMLMVLYVVTKSRILGFFSWTTFAIAAITKSIEFTQTDHFNAVLFFLGGIFFLLFARSILQTNSQTHLEVTAFSALSGAIYFPFVFFETLGEILIEITAYLTWALGNALGFPISLYRKTLELGNAGVEIILPCTAIESISLFSGATLGIRADLSRKIKAFLVSVPVIYFLNLLRNVFVTVSYAYLWFGENSFYIAHHVISKILALVSLMLIAYVVFRILPELAELIYSVKDEITRGVKV
ncbi:MAG: archaeosortase A [Archaeoglobaceae archaeon]